ncbi:MAG: leucine-rich repeat domain-containing protein [Oscillospiraceae bacterium]|jgi:hypothetical protein|nr:leucine-rich repeat domain-containing protein [Oscillospiraceae bacterium]
MNGNSKSKLHKLKGLISQYRLLSAIIALALVGAIAGVSFVLYYTHREFESWSGRLTEYHGSKSEVVIPAGITSIGIEAFKGNDKITSVVIPEGVEVIDTGAFMKCTSLKSVTFPSSLTSIGMDAFMGCDALETIVLPDTINVIGEGAFSNCENLRSVVLPSGLAVIHPSTFYACTSLAEITIPETVTLIGSRAFEGCSVLKAVTIPDAVTELGGSAFAHTPLESVVIPQNASTLGAGVFSYCKQLKSVTILSAPTEIPESAFEGCELLPEISLPQSVEEIGSRAFYRCTALQKAEFPNVTLFGERSFAECSALTGVTFNKNAVLTVYERAFLDCRSITRIHLPKNTAFIGAMAFSGCGLEEITVEAGNTNYVSKDGVLLSYTSVYKSSASEEADVIPPKNEVSEPDTDTDIDTDTKAETEPAVRAEPPESGLPDILVAFPSEYTRAEEYTVPYGIEFIFSGAFYRSNLKRVVVPEGVERIEKRNFYAMNSLTSISLPQSLTSLGEYSLSSCAALETITLPSGLTELDDGVLTDCASLAAIEVSEAGAFSSVDGVLYTADRIMLVRYPQGKKDEEFAIPGTSFEIGPYAFFKNPYLRRVIVPESTWSVGKFNFTYCEGLLTVEVRGTVTYIDSMCFAGNGDEFILRIHADGRTYAETYATEFGVRFERAGE